VTVSIGERGELQVDDVMTTRGQLVLLVRQQLSGEDRPIHIRGDRRVSYGAVADDMTTLSKAGLGKFMLSLEIASSPSEIVPERK